MSEPTRDRPYHITGWILFISCAVCYIVANIRSGDWLSLTGSVIFLLACVMFVIPLIGKNR
ncbi:MAG: hypothetical protein JEZ11_15050 [Desulfobacterales bacterium]|nr:hypothetical protein [Desulfobacterales bacterium]